MKDTIIKIDHVSKEYRLGAIGGGTLYGDLQSWWAKVRKKEDPNSRIGAEIHNERFLALDDVSFEIKKGERVGVIGHNGAGKSTLLKLLSRVTAPSDGTISYNGRIASMLEVGTGFHPEMTGRENVYMNGAILGMTKSEIDKKIDQIIEFSECSKFIDTPVKRYSSGMYVKLAFAVAAHLDSEILIMDEVLAVGDMKFQQKCLGKMDDVSKHEGRTILYVSHNMSTIRQLCERCIVLEHGKVVMDGDVEECIRYYLDNREDALKNYWDLTTTRRPFAMHGVKTHINGLRFENSETCIYASSEPMILSIEWNATVELKDLRFLFEIKALDGTNIAAVESEVVGDTGVGETHKSILQLDISCLAGGRYYFVIDMYSTNEVGVHQSYDHPVQNIYFDVLNSEPYSIIWQPQYWGHVRMHRMEYLGEKHD